MKQEFEMTQAEMDHIIDINKRRMPVMMIGEVSFGNEVIEGINDYWQELGDKYGFKWNTVEGSAKGKLFFLAEPKPKVIPKTQAEIEIDKFNTLKKIVEHLESNYSTYLHDDYAFLSLKRMADEQR